MNPTPPPEGYLLVNFWLAGIILTAVGVGFTALALALRAMWTRNADERDAEILESKALLREMVKAAQDNTAALEVMRETMRGLCDELRALKLGRP